MKGLLRHEANVARSLDGRKADGIQHEQSLVFFFHDQSRAASGVVIEAPFVEQGTVQFGEISNAKVESTQLDGLGYVSRL